MNEPTYGYFDAVFGVDEPDVMWGNGETILYMRLRLGIKDLNDSNGDPIILDRSYCVTKKGTFPE